MRKTREKVPRIRNLFDKDNMIETVAFLAIRRANPDTTKTLSRAGVSTVHEAQGRIGSNETLYAPVYAGGTRDVAD